MNQGKLEVIKQETARVNVNILGIIELKWTRMDIIQMIIISTTVGKNLWEKSSTPHSQQNSPNWSTWVQSQKWQNDLCSFPRQTIQYYSNASLGPNINAKEAEVEPFYDNLQDHLELTEKRKQKEMFFSS